MTSTSEKLEQLTQQIVHELGIAREYFEERNWPALIERIHDIQDLQSEVRVLASAQREAGEAELAKLLGTETTPS